MPSDTLSVPEAAAYLGCSVNSIRRWADLGLIPHERSITSKERRFRKIDLDRFKSNRWVSPEAS